MEKDFERRFTDFGLCYTFNGDPYDVKYVDNTARALSIVFNVEQYEHMKGPHTDAGLKVSK